MLTRSPLTTATTFGTPPLHCSRKQPAYRTAVRLVQARQDAPGP